ncbi:cysteine synthase [bacterium]|nr:cysteine synthase [bacterium]|tara:strand:+ start:8306 stop:9322 length:1017 start_codon:yes stop_codon:yes gene_type:complete
MTKDLKTKSKISSIKRKIGNTPLLRVRLKYKNKPLSIWAKFEALNFTGSIKDRMAIHIIEQAYKKDEIEPGSIIAEATSGNTGISFSGIGSQLGHKVKIYMPDWMSKERIQRIKSYGAEIIPVSREEGGFLGSIALTEKYANEENNVFLPKQFSNKANVEAHYLTTGPEILEQMQKVGNIPTGFVAGVGTGGTVMGVGQYLTENINNISINPLEPANSPTLKTGHKNGKHRIQGISDEFIPEIVNLKWLDEIVDVWDGDAIIMSQMIFKKLGLGVGISSGANLIGAIKLAKKQNFDGVICTIFCDCNKKYLSTDYSSSEEMKNHYISKDVELLDLSFF